MENSQKSQVVERIREAQNVLITVSANPSVDQLSAAIGCTLLLNKLGKHATAVFSGQVPSTLEFLKPTETLEQTTDSLRDFIIALDKAKADKLRYKVEEDSVRIFITPYRTSLSEADLNFSQGDFNVDVVIALGVDLREHIDQAIATHGRILHDATVIGVMAGQNNVDVGGINWQDASASSLCEMLVSISESFQSGILDGQMATAFLTGIVAETDRFSNQKTTPKVMTMSAQLMAAGANQQLIATELQQPAEPAPVSDTLPPVEQATENPDEAVLDLHHENDNIAINEHGEFSEVDELAQTVNEVQANSQEATLKHEKIVQPLDAPDPNEPKTDISKYIFEPPEHTGTLTANTQPETTPTNVDPLVPPTAEQNFGLNSAVPEIQPLQDDTSTPSPLISVQDDAESVVPSEIPSTPDFMLPSDGESTEDKPLGPEVHETDTLADIEQTVEQYSGEPVHTVDTEPVASLPQPSEPPQPEPVTEAVEQPEHVNTDEARQAVLDAVAASGGFDPIRPEPLQGIGAQELPIAPEPTEQPEQPVADNTPPTVPPPLLPPFPIPGAEVVEPPAENGKLPPTAPPLI